ncbi:hypothetical protein LLG39_03890, partial [bacterium]|nr:hypothetical protein [bacterium]
SVIPRVRLRRAVNGLTRQAALCYNPISWTIRIIWNNAGKGYWIVLQHWCGVLYVSRAVFFGGPFGPHNLICVIHYQSVFYHG